MRVGTTAPRGGWSRGVLSGFEACSTLAAMNEFLRLVKYQSEAEVINIYFL